MTSQTSSDFLFNAMNIDNLDGLESSGNIKLEVDESTDLLLGNKRKLEVKTEPYQVSENPDDFSIPEPQRKKIRLDTETNINNTTDINQNSNGNDGNNGNNNNNNDNINDSKSNGNSVFTFQDPPKINTNVNNTMSNLNNNNNNNNNNHHYPQQPPTYSTPTSYLLPVVPQPSSYFVPVVPHHLNPHFSPHLHHAHHPINHGYPSPFHHPHYPQYIPHYNGYHHPHSQPISVKNLVDSKKSLTKRRKRMFARNKKPKIETKDENIIDELNQDNNNDNNNTNNNNNGNNNSSTSKLINSDKSPFKTTYISHDEEVELKNTNSTLYSQFHHARQAIYNQYQQKVDAIRHSPSLNPEKRKLQIKIAAIDAKVQEKKLFLSYLEMSKPQPNSWLISNTALSMNPFARKITKQQQTPSSYNIQQQQLQQTDTNNNNNNTNDDKKENGKKTTAKRVKKPKFSEYNVRVLRDWYETHTSNPYPSSAEKHLMCQLTGLTKYQVSRWFCNVRTRKPPPELSDNDEDLTINNNGTIIVDSNGDNVNVVNNSTIPNSPHLNHHHYQQSVIPPPPPPINMHTPSNINMSNMNMVTPMNINHHHHMPPITPIPITPQHNFNFTAMNLPPNLPPITPINAGNNNIQQQNNNNNNINQNNNNQNQLQKENMIDQSENTEGLMPPINSNFINNPPPLIDENSNHMSLKNNCNEN